MGIKEQVQVRLIMKGNVQRTYNTTNSKVRIPLFHVTIFKFPSGSPENENQDENSLGEQPVENAPDPGPRDAGNLNSNATKFLSSRRTQGRTSPALPSVFLWFFFKI